MATILLDEDNIRGICLEAPWGVLYCPKCYPSKLASSGYSGSCYSWGFTLLCSHCNTSWTICRECTVQKKHLLTKTSASTHHYNWHYKKHKIEENLVAKLKCHRTDCLALPETSLPNYNGDFNNNYFKIENNLGLGSAFLVGQSQFKLPNVVKELCKDEVEMHHNIAGLVSTLTTGQQYMLGKIIKDISFVTGKHLKEKKRERLWQTRLPTTGGDIQKLYVRGKHALLPNLPRPKVQMVGSHAYVSLTDCIADLLGHGCSVDCVMPKKPDEPVIHISQSDRAQRILQNSKLVFPGEDVMVLYLVEWSDGFEPSISVKSNRGSCWLKTITISPPSHLLHSCANTYPIALGMDGESHEEVEELFAQELWSLREGEKNLFYHGGLKRNVRVYVELLASLQDQPERRKANYIMLGRSTYTAQWGHLLDFAAVASGIPGCKDCRKNLLLQHSQSSFECNKCVNWNTDSNSGLLKFDPPANYPQNLIPFSGKLSPQKVTYKLLKRAVEVAHDGIVFKGWKTSTMIDYLRAHGLNEEAIQNVKQRAMNFKKLNAVIISCSGDIQAPSFDALHKEKKSDPSMFEMWKFPAFWCRGVDLQQHIDVAMHLLFLGIVKTVMQQIQEWMVRRNKGSRFVQYADAVFDNVQRLQLTWCRITPYKNGNFGGWISENYVAAARVMAWFYGSIGDIAADPIFDEPNVEFDSWKKTHHYAWLKIRGLETAGSVWDLKQRVQKYMKQRGGPPSIPEPAGGTVENVLSMISALRSMISRLMVREVTEAYLIDLERHIKIFLNAYEMFDVANRTSNSTPSWVSSYNFCCLLNYPRVIKEFGPLRNLWEGGGMGEKVLRLVKPNWYGFKKNWQINKLDHVLRKMSMVKMREKNKTLETGELEKEMIDDLDYLSDSSADDENECNKFKDEEGRLSGLLKVYKNKGEILRMFQMSYPLSVVRLICGRFYCVCRKDIAVEVKCTEYLETICGASYHKWTVLEQAEHAHAKVESKYIQNYCVMLPKLTKTGVASEFPIYTLIDSEWNDIQKDGSICLPRIEGATYSDV